MQALTHPTRPARKADAAVDPAIVRVAISELLLDAMTCLSPTRVADTVQDLLGYTNPVSLPPDRQAALMADSLMMATTLSLFTPSSGGSTAVDRLVKQRGALKPVEAAAAAALRRARFRLLRVEDAGGGESWLRDLASGECLQVDEEAVRPGLAGLHLVAWLAPLPGGTEMFASAVTPLDEAGLTVAMGFVRPGRPELVNPLRCAEAVFRHGLQNGIVAIPGLNAPMLGEDAFEDEPSELDALAVQWAEPGAVRDSDDVRFVRGQADLEAVVAMLASAANTREHGLHALSGAYAAIAQIQMETLVRRAAAGSGTLRLPMIQEAVDRRITAGELPPGTRDIFNEVRQRLGAGSGTAPGGRKADAELDKLVGRIQALRAKTVEQGCTEQEALAAAEKVAELLDRYGLSLSEFDLRQQSCEGLAVETDRKRAGPLDDCVPAAAAFFDCRVWGEKAPGGTLRYVFFGLPADVAASRYLYDLIDQAFAGETALFRAGATYSELPVRLRRTATNSFQIGLGRGITAKLQALREARETALRSSGRDLVVVKAGIVDEELSSLGLTLRARNRSGGRRVLKDAFDQGHTAGLGFTYTPGVTQGG